MKLLPTLLDMVSSMTSRVLVGLPLCHNKEWVRLPCIHALEAADSRYPAGMYIEIH